MNILQVIFAAMLCCRSAECCLSWRPLEEWNDGPTKEKSSYFSATSFRFLRHNMSYIFFNALYLINGSVKNVWKVFLCHLKPYFVQQGMTMFRFTFMYTYCALFKHSCWQAKFYHDTVIIIIDNCKWWKHICTNNFSKMSDNGCHLNVAEIKSWIHLNFE